MFWVIPYFARTKLELPPLDSLIDISKNRLMEMEATDQADPDDNIAIDGNMEIEPSTPSMMTEDSHN